MPGKEKGDTEVPPNSHSTVVIQVSLLELVSRKCTEKEKDDTEVPPFPLQRCVAGFPAWTCQ
jgi:hypothetical protein